MLSNLVEQRIVEAAEGNSRMRAAENGNRSLEATEGKLQRTQLEQAKVARS